MSLPRGMYVYDMEDPDFLIEFGPDVTGMLQEIRIINRRTWRWVSQAFYAETREGTAVNLVLRVIELLWEQLARAPLSPRREDEGAR